MKKYTIAELKNFDGTTKELDGKFHQGTTNRFGMVEVDLADSEIYSSAVVTFDKGKKRRVICDPAQKSQALAQGF